MPRLTAINYRDSIKSRPSDVLQDAERAALRADINVIAPTISDRSKERFVRVVKSLRSFMLKMGNEEIDDSLLQEIKTVVAEMVSNRPLSGPVRLNRLLVAARRGDGVFLRRRNNLSATRPHSR